MGAGLTRMEAQVSSISTSATVSVPVLVNGSVQVGQSVTLPAAAASGIEHVVVVTMENRSFDHLMGWLPGADGVESGLTFADANNVPYPTWDLAPDFEGCGYSDPDHSYSGSRIAYDGGAMDGFLQAGNNDVFSIGYYSQADQPFFSALAQNFLVCDRYFVSILGPTFPNRMFLWAAQTDRLDDSLSLSSLPTIFDRLRRAGISHRYYFNNVPYVSFWGFRYFWSSALFDDFLADAASGNLPAVSFVDPVFTVLDDGTGNDDHPHADIRNGEAFLSTVYQAVTQSPAWSNTVLIITFDEWGGFFDHVAPPRVIAANGVDTDQVDGSVLLGFRIPAVIVSPFTVNSAGNPPVSHTVFDHTSILKLIEWRWGLAPLTPRDASPMIGNPATSMNIVSPAATAPSLAAAAEVAASPCFQGGIFGAEAAAPRTAAGNPRRNTEWSAFAASPQAQQWLQHPRFRERVVGKPRVRVNSGRRANAFRESATAASGELA
ncbi:MAG TPA: alkaline phosphatase family protein [Bryobacteraceae bacterium]|nr:alkaline phosphatase family protein [Bryobacteraceae bacterium]